jgi:RNA polymerase sigma-70 factor, ECF subfamily
MGSPDPEGEDAHLLRRAGVGDREAFDAFMERHAAPVLRFVGLHVRETDRGEDVLQETFLAAWRGAGSFRGPGSARSWLLSIARRAALREGRHRAGNPVTSFSLDSVPLDVLAREAGWGEDPGGEERRLEAKELVQAAFAALSPDDAEILVLRDLEGFSGEEVADLLGVSLAAVKSRLHRARLRFMTRIRELDHGT